MRTGLRHRVKRLGFGLCLTVFGLMLGVMAATSVEFQFQPAQAQVQTLPHSLPAMNLTIVGLNGTEVVLNSTDIASLPFTRGQGGFSPGVVDNYTGVPLANLCNLVGGITNSSTVKITGSDNYSQTFSYDQVANGNFTTYDPNTGNIVPHNEPLTLIIAYYKDDANLTNQGPLTVAIIGPEGLGTSGKLWVYYATEIQILNEKAVPEFQAFLTTFFFLIVMSTTMIAMKKRSRTDAISNRLSKFAKN